MVGNRFRMLAAAALAAACLAACNGKSADEAPGTSEAPSSVATAPATTPATTSAPSAPSAAVKDLYIEGGTEEVAASLKAKYPTLPVANLKRLNVPGEVGMFEFLAGQQVAYTNEGVDFLLVGGEMLVGAGENAVNLTERNLKVQLADAFKSIPTEGALRYVFGDGSRQVVVFSDPDCPYCQALEFMFHANKDNLNATVLIVPYPIDSLHPEADAKSRHLLCTKDPEAAWKDWMQTSAAAVGRNQTASWKDWSAKYPATPGCARADLVDKVKEYGKTYGFNQTPILMFSNGMPFLGLLDRTELEKAWEYVRTGQVPVQ